MHRLAIALALACSTGCAIGDDPTVEYDDDGEIGAADFEPLAIHGVHAIRNVAYDTTHLLDLYIPDQPTTAPRPLVVWIHGGGFAKNSRRDPHIVRLAQHSAQLGFVGVSIDYTLANPHLDAQHPFPYPWSAVTAARADALAALRFLRAHAVEYNLDPHRIAIGGASAGAMTALEVAYGSAPADRDPDIRAVVDLWGAMEQQTLLQRGDAPLVIFHGTADHLWMPYDQALRLRDSARATDVPCDFNPLPGKNHGPWEGLDDYLATIAPFLRHHLAP